MISKIVGRVTEALGGPHIGELSLDEVDSKIGQPGVHIIDVNAAETYREGHVPGARNLDNSTLSEKDLPSNKAELLVFYCGSSL